MNQSGAAQDLPVGNIVSSGGGGQRMATAPNNVLAIIGTITSQAVFITALFYYCDWVYTYSFFGHFGVDLSLVGYSTIDYVLRSINVTFDPFIYLVFVTFVLFNFHRLLVVPALMRVARDPSPLSKTVDSGVSGRCASPHYARPRISQIAVSVVGWARVLGRWRLGLTSTRRIIRALQAVAISPAIIVVTDESLPERVGVPLGLLLPLFLMLTVSLLGYIEHLRLRYADVLATAKTPWPTLPSLAYILTLLMVGVVAALWTVEHYAEHVGTRSATEIVAELPTRPGITVYSTQRIALDGPGVVVSEIKNPDTKYRHQYTGLRLLIRSADKFPLLPSKRQRGHDRIFFVQDDNSVRIDVTA